MKISRWLMLVPAIVLSAACAAGGSQSTAGGPAQGRDPLEQDVALAALGQATHGAGAVWLGGAVVCQPTPAAGRPTAAQQARAARLLQLGKAAALAGNTDGARDLLRQAAYLDGTSPAVAYQLARASEVAGDTTMAVRAYCRYLSFGASGAEHAEVRERLLVLAPGRSVPVGAARATGGAVRRARSARARVTVAPERPARTPAAATASRGADPRSSAATHDGATYEERSDGAVATRPDAAAGAAGRDGGSAVDGGNSADGPTGADIPPTAAPPRAPARRTARDAAIGAVVGAAAGAVVSRDVKGAVVGAAAGGLLGAVLGRSKP